MALVDALKGYDAHKLGQDFGAGVMKFAGGQRAFVEGAEWWQWSEYKSWPIFSSLSFR